MSCDYCDTRKRGYKTNVGKPIVRNNEGHFIEIEHDCGSPALPNRDEWRMTFWQFGVGLYASIKYCPMCGRKLPPKTAEEAARAVGRKGHDE